MNKIKRFYYEKMWRLFKWHFEKRPCFDCKYSDYLPDRETIEIVFNEEIPKHYSICDFECYHPKMKDKHTYLRIWKCKYQEKEDN